MTMGMWNDENGEKCLTKNIPASGCFDPTGIGDFNPTLRRSLVP